MQRILVSGYDFKEASEVLDSLSEGVDGGNRFLLLDENMDEAVEALNEAEIDYDII